MSCPCVLIADNSIRRILGAPLAFVYYKLVTVRYANARLRQKMPGTFNAAGPGIRTSGLAPSSPPLGFPFRCTPVIRQRTALEMYGPSDCAGSAAPLGHVRPWVWAAEAATVGHCHFGRGLRVKNTVFRDYVVQIQNIRCRGIDLIGRQRLRRAKGHCAPDVVEQDGRVRPETADSTYWLAGGQRTKAANESISRFALTFLPVASGASLCVDFFAVPHTTAPFRQTLTVGAHIDVPACNLVFRRDPPNA